MVRKLDFWTNVDEKKLTFLHAAIKKTQMHGEGDDSKLIIFYQVKISWPTIDIDGVVSNVQ